MVSVDQNHKPELIEQLKTYNPGIKITDMENGITTTDTSSSLNHNGHHSNGGSAVIHMHKNGHVKNSYNDEVETSFVNGHRQTPKMSIGEYYKSGLKNGQVPSMSNFTNNGVPTTYAETNNNYSSKDLDLDRLKKYEQGLQKRREAEERQAKEEEFLRYGKVLNFFSHSNENRHELFMESVIKCSAPIHSMSFFNRRRF